MPIYYLAGPMSGLPRHNIPAFVAAAAELREAGYTILTPVELDGGAFSAEVYKDETGEATNMTGAGHTVLGVTAGQLLARDVELVWDTVTGIVFLPDWHKSRGARLEAFVGLLRGHEFADYVGNGKIIKLHALGVMSKLARATYAEIKARA